MIASIIRQLKTNLQTLRFLFLSRFALALANLPFTSNYPWHPGSVPACGTDAWRKRVTTKANTPGLDLTIRLAGEIEIVMEHGVSVSDHPKGYTPTALSSLLGHSPLTFLSGVVWANEVSSSGWIELGVPYGNTEKSRHASLRVVWLHRQVRDRVPEL
jgi:hypothetical protein